MRRLVPSASVASMGWVTRAYSPEQLGSAVRNAMGASSLEELGVERVHEAHHLVADVVRAVDPTMKLYAFGSTSVYGFHERNSDVDFVVLREEDIADGKGEDSQSQLAKGLQTELLVKLGKRLQDTHLDWSVDAVKRARVPVVKIKSKTLDFDITAFRRNGVRNSALLRAYMTQNPDLRWVSIAVKHWSKRCGMNGPLGYLTSYGFNILVVYFLLQRGHLSFVDPDQCCASAIEPVPPGVPLAPPQDPALIGKLLMDFLGYYRREFNLNDDVVTLSRPGVTKKQQLNWTKEAEDIKLINAEKVAYRLCIEDPYEINLNVGRKVTAFKLDMMMRTFDKGLQTGMGFL